MCAIYRLSNAFHQSEPGNARLWIRFGTFTHNTGVQVSWRAIPSLISRYSAVPQWDATTSSPYFTYQGQLGADHVVWYEDATSIPLKSALVRAYGLAGVSVFALGKDDHDYWQAVYSSF